MSKTYYITTPIYYPNAEPHLGHIYTTIASDVVARYHRLAGEETWFLTGTDEHGTKMVKTATDQGLEPRALADRYAAVFRELWDELRITHDDFIRTTEDRHKIGVQEIVRRLLASDDIYLGGYEGWYDVGQEEFVAETEAKENDYKSKITGKPLTRYKEPSYFFRLDKYRQRILDYIDQHPHFIVPESRRNEVISKLKPGVEDLSISRATLKWGIPLPNDPEHVLYVWIDALSNYITALGYGAGDDEKFRRYWPANAHIIGKDILWFHAVYWPAMLFSLGLEPPKSVVAHGWFKGEGRKMSKTLGNFVDLEKVRATIALYGLDSLRYFLLSVAPFGEDPDWSEAGLAKSHTELANVLGNCLNRGLKMINKYRGGQIPAAAALEEIDHALLAKIEQLPAALAGAYDRYALQQCAHLPLELARATNGYIDATAPFSLAKDPAKAGRLDTVLALSARAIRTVLVGLLPVLPEKAAAGLEQLGVTLSGKTLAELFAEDASGGKVKEGQPLFPRIEAK